MKIPNTLFFKTATTLIITLLLLTVIILASTAYFVMVPVGKRSADDLAALLVLSAQTWAELPPETRPYFEAELLTAHGIKLIQAKSPLLATNKIYILMYQRLLQNSLQQRLGNQAIVTMGSDIDRPGWIWINLPTVKGLLQFGIAQKRIGARPPVALLAMLIAVLVLAIGTALIIALRITRPLEKLSLATTEIGKGEKIELVEDSGPDEIKTLAHNFNKMSHEVSELLENRTTLLAGISHDLRTPLTRMRLSLELNEYSNESTSQSGLQNNIDEIENLLDKALLLARGSDRQEPLKQRDLVSLLSTLASQHEAEWLMQHPESHCTVLFNTDNLTESEFIVALPEQSFLRVLNNLIENALRYGDNKQVVICLGRQGKLPLISILDNGPGIPEKELEAVFRPFYRLEQSRNLMTGGSGLGLAIVAQLCQSLGWKITLRARQEGGLVAEVILSNMKD